jgi:hypothetical protein
MYHINQVFVYCDDINSTDENTIKNNTLWTSIDTSLDVNVINAVIIVIVIVVVVVVVIIIIIIIIITGKTALFEPQPSLEDSTRYVIRFSLF